MKTIEDVRARLQEVGRIDAAEADAVLRRLADRTSLEISRATLPESAAEIAGMIDHTALRPETTPWDVERLCGEAVQYGFAAVCVHPCYVPLAASILADKATAVCTVVGFPLGANHATDKANEAEAAVRRGACEIDMVLNVGMLRSAHFAYVEADVRSVVEAIQGEAITKVILETVLLSDEEKVVACLIAERAGADFVKTSTGFASRGATVEDVALMHQTVGSRMGVKAAGGIRTAVQARQMIRAGATRLGASSSVGIVRDAAGEEDANVGSSEY